MQRSDAGTGEVVQRYGDDGNADHHSAESLSYGCADWGLARYLQAVSASWVNQRSVSMVVPVSLVIQRDLMRMSCSIRGSWCNKSRTWLRTGTKGIQSLNENCCYDRGWTGTTVHAEINDHPFIPAYKGTGERVRFNVIVGAFLKCCDAAIPLMLGCLRRCSWVCRAFLRFIAIRDSC